MVLFLVTGKIAPRIHQLLFPARPVHEDVRRKVPLPYSHFGPFAEQVARLEDCGKYGAVNCVGTIGRRRGRL